MKQWSLFSSLVQVKWIFFVNVFIFNKSFIFCNLFTITIPIISDGYPNPTFE